MADIYSLLNEISGKGSFLAQYGYQYPTAMEYFLLMYDLSELNKKGFDPRTAKVKGVATKMDYTPTGESVKWYTDNLKEATVSINSVTDANTFVLDSTAIVVGETLYNRNTRTSYFVTTSSAGTIDINGAGDSSAAAGDVLERVSFSKKYQQNDGFRVSRNAYTAYENYIHMIEIVETFGQVDLNKTRIFFKDDREYVAEKIADMARKAIKSQVQGYFVGTKLKYTSGSDTRYSAGGLDYYLPSAYKVNIKGINDEATRWAITNQVAISYRSGVDVTGMNSMFFCNSGFLQLLDRLYDPKLVLNEKIETINVNVKTINIAGGVLKVVHSNVLDGLSPTVPMGYLIPINDTFLFNVPVVSVENGGQIAKNQTMNMYLKPVTTYESRDLALYASHTYVYGAIDSGAYQRWIYV